jgi:branched-subunit amino acid transport protein
MSDGLIWVAILGLAAVSVITRGFFLLSDRPWPMPGWAREALRVAPLAALVAVIAPEIFLDQGEMISTWRDPRWPAALVASLYYFWRRSILGTIVTGTAVLLLLRLGLGWT